MSRERPPTADLTPESDDAGLDVLQLVTSPRPFFDDQVRILERLGATCTVLEVPGEHDPEAGRRRSVTDYVRFYPRVLDHGLDDYDLVHANFGLTAPAALAQPTRPVVVSLWGTDLHGEFGWLSRWCATRADATVVMSAAMAADLDQPCHVVPHGVDTERFRPMDGEAARDRLGWSAEALHVLFPYAPDREVKNFPRAERVAENADRRLDAPVELHAVSGVPHERVATYMNAADAMLLTSKREGSPNAVKEALACQLPVVATDVGDVRERLSGVANTAVGRSDAELVDALVEVLERGERSDGREAVRDITLERMGHRLLSVYRRAMGKGGERPGRPAERAANRREARE
ncbi:glycosyltransferase [Halorarius halobius]|uniref:glycosyltransferase n=1 Tax=Halorarius halobius TaxID=2962671 RepID=UPI0020CD7C61|nr:glycosyltransferase [Halorarius halobius]